VNALIYQENVRWRCVPSPESKKAWAAFASLVTKPPAPVQGGFYFLCQRKVNLKKKNSLFKPLLQR
jgi:hypothetical protein